MNTVVAPIDFSDSSEKVVEIAAQVAVAFKRELVLLHIMEPEAQHASMVASMDVFTATLPMVQLIEPQPALQTLERFATPLRKNPGLAVRVDVRLGLAVDEILSCTAAYQADMIIVGSHGHGALYHLLAGSVVTGLLKRSPVPVLVVPVRETK